MRINVERILTIVVSRNTDNEDRSIDSFVDFPLERVCPSTLGVQQDEIADNTAYKLFGIVQHTSNANGGGHYTAITHNDTANLWQLYDDHDVTICKFRNRGTNKALVQFQKTASILFYKREGAGHGDQENPDVEVTRRLEDGEREARRRGSPEEESLALTGRGASREAEGEEQCRGRLERTLKSSERSKQQSSITGAQRELGGGSRRQLREKRDDEPRSPRRGLGRS